MPDWVCGDSMAEVEKAPSADLLFTCPPYGDLEEYSSDPLDLSHMTHAAFLLAYRSIIAKACQRLRDNRFACIVVGDFRDPAGNYRNFVSDTIAAFLDAGLKLQDEAVLQTSVGSSAIRVTKIFGSGRKFCKTHQNVLTFVKGSAAAAMQAAAEVSA
jgi:DNA modification methylase